MKKARRQTEQELTAERWYELARTVFPELALEEFDPKSTTQICSACEEFAWLAERAHETPNCDDLLTRAYGFVRWSIRNTNDENLKGCIADSFFDRLLSLPASKIGCLEFLDWGDVELLCAWFTVEPAFDDVENFDRLCAEWKRRWSRNQKLKPPTKPAEQGGVSDGDQLVPDSNRSVKNDAP